MTIETADGAPVEPAPAGQNAEDMLADLLQEIEEIQLAQSLPLSKRAHARACECARNAQRLLLEAVQELREVRLVLGDCEPDPSRAQTLISEIFLDLAVGAPSAGQGLAGARGVAVQPSPSKRPAGGAAARLAVRSEASAGGGVAARRALFERPAETGPAAGGSRPPAVLKKGSTGSMRDLSKQMQGLVRQADR